MKKIKYPCNKNVSSFIHIFSLFPVVFVCTTCFAHPTLIPLAVDCNIQTRLLFMSVTVTMQHHLWHGL